MCAGGASPGPSMRRSIRKKSPENGVERRNWRGHEESSQHQEQQEQSLSRRRRPAHPRNRREGVGGIPSTALQGWAGSDGAGPLSWESAFGIYHESKVESNQATGLCLNLVLREFRKK